MNQVHEQSLQVVSCSSQQRKVVKCELLKIGYSAKDATKAVSEMTDEEVQFLYQNPKAIKRSGVIIAVLAVMAIVALIASLVAACADKKKAAKTTKTRTVKYKKPTVITKTKKVVITTCKACNGSGKKTCPTCGGDGKLEDITDDSGNPCICPECNGKISNEKCPVCRGTGKIVSKK